MISANGNINIEGEVTARGGNGATPMHIDDKSLFGGGGSGGRIALYGKTVTTKQNIDVSLRIIAFGAFQMVQTSSAEEKHMIFEFGQPFSLYFLQFCPLYPRMLFLRSLPH